ncbi:MAG: Nramp family divalent metal transporter [Saprospiraceae bacterium]|nr:Nramp family divalent metal transporter [Saprospiraceae bacterium]
MLKRLFKIGPGAMVAAAFIGPGTVTTATLSGAKFGYTLLWAVAFSVLATLVLQEMAARLGLAGDRGLGEAIREKITGKWSRLFSGLLVIGAILIGNAAYEAGNITGAVIGFNSLSQTANWMVNPLIPGLAVVAFLLLYSGKYKLIERSLILMVATMGIVFLWAAFMAKPDWWSILKGFFQPQIPEHSLLMVVGLIGTTVVPYNLFLHAATVREKWNGPEEISDARFDTILSVILGGIITASIVITSAVVLHSSGTEINNAYDLASQLTPFMGKSANWFIALGFLAAGLSSAITAPLAAAYATSGLMGWQSNLQAPNFRAIWIFVLLSGLVFASWGFKPISVILFAQVANGLLLPIIAAFLLWTMNDRQLMGRFINSPLQNGLGFIILFITLILGIKSIITVF